ncbi:MFS transporter, DHA1 family, multidrug resistance protein [Caldanaerovirga acetigignens]|uniref:MFS transporter, DHA1 family, multidrug resistance protein n=1 Tax=Caldanaerovirga acetigignens TaxID=447595 RepID=A0A1M7L4H6_9FIRM|nr:MFS transporter [Caldanaerovirga acetigignens]SHM72468.1 MFS transporter, DHA1 family, multidrug resistance protein [Caldanaerovirga acetigignens]
MNLTSFSAEVRNVIMISAGVFIAQAVFSSITPFLPSLLLEMGTKSDIALWSSLIYAANFITTGIMAPLWGAISDRYGKKPMMARAGFGMGVAYLLMSYAKTPVQLFLLRALNGAFSGYIPAAVTFVAATSSAENLSHNISLVNAASAVGSIIGPLLGGISAKFLGVRRSLILGSIILFVAGALPYATGVLEPKESRKNLSIKEGIAQTLRNTQLLLIFTTGFLMQGAIMAILPTLNLVMQNIAPQNAEFYTGLVFSIIGISTAIASPIVGRLTGIPLTTLYRVSLLGSTLITALQGFANSVSSLLILRFIFGFFNAAMTIACNVLIAKNGNSSSHGSSFGVYNGIISLGLVFGSTYSGIMGNRFGLAYSFFASASMFFAAFLISFFIKEPASSED